IAENFVFNGPQLSAEKVVLLGSITQCLLPSKPVVFETSMPILMFRKCSEVLCNSDDRAFVLFSSAKQKFGDKETQDILFPSGSYVFTDGMKEVVKDSASAMFLSAAFVAFMKTSNKCAVGWQDNLLSRDVYTYGITISLYGIINEIEVTQCLESEDDIAIPDSPNQEYSVLSGDDKDQQQVHSSAQKEQRVHSSAHLTVIEPSYSLLSDVDKDQQRVHSSAQKEQRVHSSAHLTVIEPSLPDATSNQFENKPIADQVKVVKPVENSASLNLTEQGQPKLIKE
ncbi:hypothetical protein HDV02_000846, partial [Globomyces sp. JEL0801]